MFHDRTLKSREAAMGKAIVSIPLVTWRDGRPRFFPSPAARELGYKGEDLRHPGGAWFSIEECLAWSKARMAEMAEKRAAIAAGETTARKTANALARARREGLVTVGQVFATFEAAPRMRGIAVVEGRKKRRPLKENTARFYRTAARALEAFDGGRVWHAPAVELTGQALGGILHKFEIDHGLAMTRALRAAIAAAFKHGRRAGIVHHNPIAALEETLPVPEARVRTGSVEEMRTLIATADAIGMSDVGDAIMLGLFTGQRQADRLMLEDGAAVDGDAMRFAQSKKHGAPLLIPRARPLRARLAAAALRRDRRLNWSTVLLDERLARPWDQERYRKAFRVLRHCAAHGDAPRGEDGALTKDAKLFLQGVDVPARLAAAGVAPLATLADFRDQDLRDTAVTWLTLAGASKWEVASITGHSLKSIDEILRHYFGPHPDLARSAIGKLESWFGGQ